MTWKDSANAVKWIPILNAAEVKYGIPKDLLARQCYQESRFNPLSRNPIGAVGLMQLLPQYFPGAGKNPSWDVYTAGAYLGSLYKRFSDWQLALAGYDWGPGSVSKWQKSGDSFERMPKETHDYVTQIVADVPVQGVLCKIQSLSPVSGSQPAKPLAAPSSVLPPPKSLWRSAIDIFKPRSGPNLPAQLPHSALPFPPISSQTKVEVSMSTPNPITAAAAPSLIMVLQAVQQFLTNLGTDPALVVAKFPGALQVLLGTAELQLPILASAEFGALQVAANTKITAWIKSLQAPSA